MCIYIYLFIYLYRYLYIYIYIHGKCGNAGLSFEASLLLSHYRRGFCKSPISTSVVTVTKRERP